MVTERESEARTDGAETFLELGFLYLRLHQITNEKDDYESARDAFDRAKQLAPRNAWSHYGDAASLAYGPDVRLHGSQLIQTGRSWAQELGLDARSKARRAAERALEIDPAFAQAAELFAGLAIFGQSRGEMERARDALARVIARGRATDRSFIMLSRVSGALGDAPAALDAAEAAARHDASPEALHAVAAALLRTPGREADGANAWFAMVETMSDDRAERVWMEVGPIADTAETRQWRDADLDGRKAMMRKFWTLRAGEGAVSVPERLAEHYRRLAVAIERFPRNSDGAQPSTETLLRDRDPSPFDERGIVYLRHGEPDVIISTDTPFPYVACGPPTRRSVIDNESWVYRPLGDRRRMIHFLRCVGYPDWIVPYETPCGEGTLYVLDRQGYDDDATMCNERTPERVRTFALDRLRDDSHRPRFDAVLPFGYDLLAFRGPDGRTDLSAPVAVLTDSLPPDSLADGQLAYRLSLSMFVVDTIAGTVTQADTTVVYRTTRAPSRGEVLVAYVNASTAPTEDALHRIVIRDGGDRSRGQLHGARIRVPSYAGDTLMVSSIVLAVPGEGGNWRRGDTQLTVMPVGEFAGGAFRAFYEVYNLPENTPYQTEVIVDHARGDLDQLTGEWSPGDPVIRLRFEGVAAPDARGVVNELRSIETGLLPGRYRIHVRVTNLETRATATSQRLFAVTRPDRS
jgi:GWxTD domain-containing protein